MQSFLVLLLAPYCVFASQRPNPNKNNSINPNFHKFVGRGFALPAETIEDKEGRIKLLENKELETLSQRLGVVENENNELRGRLEFQKQAVEQRNNALATLENLQKEQARQQSVINNRSKDLKAAIEKLKATTAEVSELKQTLNELKATKESYRQENESLVKAKQEMEQNYEKKMEELKSTATSNLEKLQKEHAKQLSLHRTRATDLKAANEKLSDAQAEISNLKQSARELDDLGNSYRQEYLKVLHSHQKLESDYDANEHKLSKLQEASQAEIKNLREQCAATEQRLKDQKNELEEALSQCATTGTVCSTLISKLEEEQKEKNELQSTIDSATLLLSRELESQETIASGIVKLIEKYETRLKQVNDQIYASRLDFEEVSLQNSLNVGLKEQVTILQERFELISAIVEELHGQIAEKDEKIVSLKKEVEDYKTIHEFIEEKKS